MAWPKGTPRKKRVEAPPPAVEPVKLDYEKAVDRNHDFTGWHLSKLPHWAPKAARAGAVASDIVIGKRECVECRQECWYCDDREDLCEQCDYTLRERNRDLVIQRAHRNNMRVSNPFKGNTSVPKIFWPRG